MLGHMTIENEVRKVYSSAVPTTTSTSLPMIRKEGTDKMNLYAVNKATCTVYGLMRGAALNTAATALWFTIGATATIAASSTTCIQSYSVSAWQAPYNWVTFEYAAGATGGVSALTLQLSVW